LIDLYENLSWLPRPGADFTAKCRALGASPEGDGTAIRLLATAANDINQLTRLAKTIGTVKSRAGSLRPLTPFRLGILSNGTMDYFVTALIATAPRFGIALDVIATSFDQALQEAIDPSSDLHLANPDAVLIALDYRGFGLQATLGDEGRSTALVEAALNQLDTICAGLRSSQAVSIVQTVVPPSETLFGSLDAMVSGTTRQMCDALNIAIRQKFTGGEALVFDSAALAETVGLARWHDPTQWALAKLPCSLSMVPLYADHLCRLIGALRGQSRRALILDLDNTLWGGVIGDDGMNGITIGQGDATGEAYLALHRYALDLRQRGVVLAVSSKNDDEVARQPFREHPDMLLKEYHFAVFQANWSDKASNIEAIADALSLGLDAFVFVDDNPAERALVRQKLPEVAVPEIPSDPALYVRTLAAAGYFEATSFSAEDRKRSAYYEGNARRLELQSGSGDLDSYLRSLKMTATFAPFDAISRNRITQLINKSNQFNLTTRRYTEAEVAALERDPNVFTLQVRLSDQFGDNGMICVVICRREHEAWMIDTWLMSCRVLKRRVEEAVLLQLADHANRRGIIEFHGKYIPSGRNSMVKDHYAKLGFTAMNQHLATDRETEWRIRVADIARTDLPLEIKSFEMFGTEVGETSPV
jgi:FkbH-like protein